MTIHRIASKSLLGLGVLSFALLFVFGTAAFSQGIDRPDPVYEITQWNGREVIEGETLVQFKANVPDAAALSLHDAIGTAKVETIAEGLDRVTFSDDMTLEEVLAAYNQNPNVDFAEPNLIYHPNLNPNDSYWGNQWGPKKINCPTAWDTYTGNPSHVVAMLDSGVDMDHPDLQGHYAWGYDYYSNDPNPDDSFGHGSHTAGTAAAVTNNGIGVAGVAFDCMFAAYRVGDYYLSTSAIVSAINDARIKGALAISMSFGGGPSSSIQIALTNAYNAGIVNVASASNNGNTVKSYPAAYSNVIAVAASTSTDSKASFSTYGNWVDVAAPGVNILSTYKNKQYAYMDGTSMSCPHVSGMAVILYSMLGGQRSMANADIVRNAIQDSAKYVGTWVIHGRVDLKAAMDLLPGGNPPTITDISPATVQSFQGGTITVTGTDFIGTSKVTVGGNDYTNFTIVDATTLTFGAPTATVLGQTSVTVTTGAGTSNPGYFDYVETDPPKLSCPVFTNGGASFTWSYGGGADDYFMLIVATDNTTFTYKTFPVLAYFTTLYSASLDPAGIGSLPAVIPTGLAGLSFYSQVLTFDDQNNKFVGATGIKSTIILN